MQFRATAHPATSIFWWLTVFTSAACILLPFVPVLCGPAAAQVPTINDQSSHAEGLIPDTHARLKGTPNTPLYRGFLPAHVDLSANFPPPGNQGQQSSCVGWAVGYAARAYYVARRGRDVNEKRNIPSPAYIYDTIKPSGSCATGSRISDALDLLKKGAASLRAFPYSSQECSAPSPLLQARVRDFRIKDWELVDPINLDQIKAQLYHKNPVIIALHDSTGFDHLRADHVLRSPGRYIGWHAVTVVGYDEHRQAFKLINSWGRRWGDGGFGWIGYDAFKSEVRQAYVMKPNKPSPPKPPKPSPPIVSTLPHPACSKLAIKHRGGRRVIIGFVGHKADLKNIQRVANGAEVDVKLRPWPQCEALLTLNKALSSPNAPSVTIHAPASKILYAGNHLVFEIRTPPFSSYLHVTYFQADGSAINLIQPGATSFKSYAPNSRLIIGSKSSYGRRFRVSAPFGHEMLLVLAAKSPIFTNPRPFKETQRAFLTALRRAMLYKTDPNRPTRDIVAGYDAIVTKKDTEANRR